ncbi:hypothetical protein MTBSS4_620001 [Magnetospirillum sp. SS-4]|nr:hypothetical protein MTBSS4_620001 [Magnetospirillum sp. SS-4]
MHPAHPGRAGGDRSQYPHHPGHRGGRRQRRGHGLGGGGQLLPQKAILHQKIACGLREGVGSGGRSGELKRAALLPIAAPHGGEGRAPPARAPNSGYATVNSHASAQIWMIRSSSQSPSNLILRFSKARFDQGQPRPRQPLRGFLRMRLAEPIKRISYHTNGHNTGPMAWPYGPLNRRAGHPPWPFP